MVVILTDLPERGTAGWWFALIGFSVVAFGYLTIVLVAARGVYRAHRQDRQDRQWRAPS